MTLVRFFTFIFLLSHAQITYTSSSAKKDELLSTDFSTRTKINNSTTKNVNGEMALAVQTLKQVEDATEMVKAFDTQLTELCNIITEQNKTAANKNNEDIKILADEVRKLNARVTHLETTQACCSIS